MPPKMQECLDSWTRVMPDYEIWKWDDERIKEFDNIFIREAIEEKKWAFVSDVARVYAIAKYGGIYLDTDVYVYKSFDSLLKNKAFIGRESSMHLIDQNTVNFLTTCCFGAEKGNEFIIRCLDYYKDRHFITSHNKSLPPELRLDIRLNSEVFALLASEIGYNPSVLHDTEQHCGDTLVVYPSFYFDGVGVHKSSYSVHLALGTWRDNYQREWTYSWKDKISWRFWAIIEKLLRVSNRTLIKLN